MSHHHNRDGCNPYDEAHIAGKAGADPEPRITTPTGIALKGYVLGGGRDPRAILNSVAAIEAQAREDATLPKPCGSCESGRGCAVHRARAQGGPPLAETMTRLADGPRSKWHDEVLPNGASESWVCVPIGDVLDALPAEGRPSLDVERLHRAADHMNVAHQRWVWDKVAAEYARLGVAPEPPEDAS